MSSRIVIVNPDKCNPSKCNKECKNSCPVNRVGKQCIEIVPRVDISTSTSSLSGTGVKKSIAQISEELCIGCGICVNKCPFDACTVINLPHELPETTHRYGINTFKLHNLPMPRVGSILGLVGSNGTGKSTALQILAGKIIPNFGECDITYSKKDIMQKYKGTSLFNYFKALYTGVNFKVLIKPQYVDVIKVAGTVKNTLDKLNKLDAEKFNYVVKELTLESLFDKEINVMSGGELQRFTIACTLIQEADVYMFDEPSSYLDIRQRVAMSKAIRNILLPKQKYVIVVEHDLSVLDYLSDYICCLYGKPGAYGIISLPFTCGEGINVYLDGKIPTDNLRFRKEPLDFKFSSDKSELIQLESKNKEKNKKENENIKSKSKKNESSDVDKSSEHSERSERSEHSEVGKDIETDVDDNEIISTAIHYPELTKKFEGFEMRISAGMIFTSQITCLLGENGTGKTTFIKLLCGLLKPDNGVIVPTLNVSYKPQIIKPSFKGSVSDLFNTKINSAYSNSAFRAEVIKPLDIENILDQPVTTLSGGELQRVAIILALGKPADIYLIDEPSAYLDVDQRLIVSKVIKKFIINNQRYCFLVEHDFIMATYLADRVIVLEKKESETKGTIGLGENPMAFEEGFNLFLKHLNITFRRDITSYRPRINKENSQSDKAQKTSGNYFYTDANDTKPISSFSAGKTINMDW